MKERSNASTKQKPPTLIGFAITAILSAVAGAIPTAILASADNGYVAGYAVLPLLLLISIVCILLFICAVVFIAKEKFAVGLYFLLSVLLVPAFWVGSSTAAKHFEIGAYRVEPMRPMIPPVANKIVFKKGVSSDEVQDFWRDILSQPNSSGRGEMSLHGIQSIGTLQPEDGSEVLVYSYFESATDDEKAMVKQKIVSSPKVLRLLENVQTNYWPLPEPSIETSNSNQLKRDKSTFVLER